LFLTLGGTTEQVTEKVFPRRRLTSAAKADSENKPVTAVNRCATQNQDATSTFSAAFEVVRFPKKTKRPRAFQQSKTGQTRSLHEFFRSLLKEPIVYSTDCIVVNLNRGSDEGPEFINHQGRTITKVP
jgi:hypothetical protein